MSNLVRMKKRHSNKREQIELEIKENAAARLARMVKLLEIARDQVERKAPPETTLATIGEIEAAVRKERRTLDV